MDYDTSVFGSQTFNPFDISGIDAYNLDVDPDQNVFSSFNVSNFCSFYNES